VTYVGAPVQFNFGDAEQDRGIGTVKDLVDVPNVAQLFTTPTRTRLNSSKIRTAINTSK
jgi:hypothetical protein